MKENFMISNQQNTKKKHDCKIIYGGKYLKRHNFAQTLDLV